VWASAGALFVSVQAPKRSTLAALEGEIAMRTSQTAYRGYGIDVFGKGNHWHFSARPISLHLPILVHNAFAVDAKSETLALATAKQQIDSLLT
jgi:hypothetical protein